ncbi:MAG: glutamate--tRNA ligase [Bacteroidetes bacterium]|nr:glutamate--tRNA ligase [Bacteroidota bacterium]
MNQEVRTRFAPSPTGGLHLGGVRTALFSYLFAKKHKGSFVLRVEDTDQNRYVEGAEQYIIDCLAWCGISPDEGPHKPGEYAPYRQSERKLMYKQYALQLVESGHAYYAFDTSEELEKMREELKSEKNPSPQYDASHRMHMKNSLSLLKEETDKLLQENTPYVIRIKMPQNEIISFNDMIRGEIKNEADLVDDKVLLKADGMPTYHLAVVVDDYLMKITHAFRGEEWLPSAPVHIKLWEYLGWKESMPQWAHLPLILKPDGNGKLSKRDGDRLGFPVFAMDWHDPKTGDTTKGFKELGFLPEAFINLLALLGWHSGEEKELFTKEELIAAFSMERVHKGGAKFDFDKAKWFNHEWIKKLSDEDCAALVKPILTTKGLKIEDDSFLIKAVHLVKERCVLLNDFYEQSIYLFESPFTFDLEAIQAKWTDEKKLFFIDWINILESLSVWQFSDIETSFKNLATEKNIKPGELQLPFRIMLVGAKHGIGVFHIADMIGKEDTVNRMKKVLGML